MSITPSLLRADRVRPAVGLVIGACSMPIALGSELGTFG
jgi:hypothetical protein